LGEPLLGFAEIERRALVRRRRALVGGDLGLLDRRRKLLAGFLQNRLLPVNSCLIKDAIMVKSTRKARGCSR
jgi:hypothetical protein